MFVKLRMWTNSVLSTQFVYFAIEWTSQRIHWNESKLCRWADEHTWNDDTIAAMTAYSGSVLWLAVNVCHFGIAHTNTHSCFFHVCSLERCSSLAYNRAQRNEKKRESNSSVSNVRPSLSFYDIFQHIHFLGVSCTKIASPHHCWS